MRTKIIAGNWKMNKTREEAIDFSKKIKKNYRDDSNMKIIISPPFTSLEIVFETLKDTRIKVAAQNMFYEEEGAYTGEVSPKMIKDTGAQYVILGHSERRKYFYETDDTVNKKLKKALEFSLIPIVCIGENLDEREEGKAFKKIGKQIVSAMADIGKQQIKNVIIAYEPIWAIGTGKTASPEQAEEVHCFIREKIQKKYGNEVAEYAIILYGGSVKPHNAFSLMKKENIDGVLIGGASLDLESFLQIIEEARKI